MEANEEKQKRKVHRSPSYPVFDLTEAITKAEAIYKNEKRSATTAEVLASHMGYSTAGGPGGRAVSALRQYGLIEESSGKYRLSDLGYTLIHFNRHSDEWMAAICVAVRNPTLFRELLDEYPDGLPSDATLRNDLLKREFNPASIQDVVGIFRNTMSLADSGDIVHNGAGDDSVQPTQERPQGQAGRQTPPPPPPIGKAMEISLPVGTSGDGEIVFATVRFSSGIKRNLVASLRALLEAMEKTLPDGA